MIHFDKTIQNLNTHLLVQWKRRFDQFHPDTLPPSSSDNHGSEKKWVPPMVVALQRKRHFSVPCFFLKEYLSKKDLKAPLANSTFQPMHFGGFSCLVNDDMCVSRSGFASEKAQAFGDAMWFFDLPRTPINLVKLKETTSQESSTKNPFQVVAFWFTAKNFLRKSIGWWNIPIHLPWLPGIFTYMYRENQPSM